MFNRKSVITTPTKTIVWPHLHVVIAAAGALFVTMILLMTSLKTLRYPQKFRAVKRWCSSSTFFYYKEFREPFLGGGSVCCTSHRRTHLMCGLNDLYEPLYTFWTQSKSNGKEIRNELIQLKQRHPDPTSASILLGGKRISLNQSDLLP